jgi:hypothetical protein
MKFPKGRRSGGHPRRGLTYPNAPGYNDNDTALEAAALFASKLAPRQAIVLVAFRRHGPSTADEIAEKCGLTADDVRKRVSELKELRALMWTGDRRPTVFNRKQRVYRATTPEESADGPGRPDDGAASSTDPDRSATATTSPAKASREIARRGRKAGPEA